jgi:DNA-binding MarR family transcriptional regulator
LPRNKSARDAPLERPDFVAAQSSLLATASTAAASTASTGRPGALWSRPGARLIIGAMGKYDETVFALLGRAHAVAQKAAREMLMESGVSPLEAWLLDLIPHDGRACASELAHKLDVPTSTVTRALRRMETYGYLTLIKGFFFDARVLRAKLTPMGTMVRDGARGFERDLDGALLEGISQHAFAGLLAGLYHIERKAQQYVAVPEAADSPDSPDSPGEPGEPGEPGREATGES